MASTIRRFENRNNYEDGAHLFFNYKYDQLNRLISMESRTGFDTTQNKYTGLTLLPELREQLSYDANGNIQTLFRSNKGTDAAMDDLTYLYYPGTNKLKKVNDKVSATKWGVNSWDPMVDIDSQTVDTNYVYDAIGNLIKDASEKISNIKWNVYGKIQEITKEAKGSQTIKLNYT